MHNKIIVVANQKGGAGKTTISMQLAGTLARRGLKILVVDADKQNSAQEWAAEAPDDQPFPATVIGMGAMERRVGREVVNKHMELYDFVIIDCPPAVDSVASRSALGAADLAIIPVLPSPIDIRATIPFRDLVDEQTVSNEDLMPYLLRNKWNPRTELSRICGPILEEFKFPIMDTYLGDLEAFKKAGMGVTVHDLSKKENHQAVPQVEALADEVLSILGFAEETKKQAVAEN